MKEKIKAFFDRYPAAPSLYQVGDQLFLIKYFKLADRLSKYTGKRVVTIQNPNLKKAKK